MRPPTSSKICIYLLAMIFIPKPLYVEENVTVGYIYIGLFIQFIILYLTCCGNQSLEFIFSGACTLLDNMLNTVNKYSSYILSISLQYSYDPHFIFLIQTVNNLPHGFLLIFRLTVVSSSSMLHTDHCVLVPWFAIPVHYYF